MSDAKAPAPLAGLKVIEVATYVFGPATAAVLSDFGAEVIKIEAPGLGDMHRHLHRIPPMPTSDVPYFFMLEGRNKESVALQLKRPEGREILDQLLAKADVFVTNFRLSALVRLGLTYDRLQTLNGRLIYAMATGFGETGDDRERPGFDFSTYWARSGLMDMVRSSDADPCIPPPGMGDHPAAMALFGAIMMALYQRERTGAGSKVSTSLIANGAWANGCLLQAALLGVPAAPPRPRRDALNAIVNHYVTRDGRRVLLCCLQGEQDWPRLCAALDRPDWRSDPRFATADDRKSNAPELIRLLDEAIGARDFDDVRDRFTRCDVVWSLVATHADVPDDAQMAAIGVFREIDDPVHGRLRTIDSPIHISTHAKAPPRPAPRLGEHTRAVLARELGFDADRLDRLLQEGIIATDASE